MSSLYMGSLQLYLIAYFFNSSDSQCLKEQIKTKRIILVELTRTIFVRVLFTFSPKF